MNLSVVAPAYNEEGGIHAVITAWVAFLRSCDEVGEFEIIICNDGSKDATGQILEGLAGQYHEVKPLHLVENRGAGVAMAAAVRASIGSLVLTMDSDGQFDIAGVRDMLRERQLTGAALINGARHKADGAYAKFGSWLSGAICNVFLGSTLRDFNSAMKLVDGPLLRSIYLEARTLNYSTEMTAKCLERGVKLAEVSVGHLPRETGASSMRLARGSWERLQVVSYLLFRRALLRVRVLFVEPYDAG